MTEPTLESLNEAARLTGFKDWSHVQSSESPQYPFIIAHALTLDELHGRKEVSEAETFYREITSKSLGFEYDGDLDQRDKEAIALIEAKFAELRLEWLTDMVAPQPKEPEWIEWHGGECPVAPETRVEVKFRSGECNSKFKAGTWNWKHSGWASDIIAYRVL